MFRLGIAAELLSATLFIFVGLAMFNLFKGRATHTVKR